MVTKTKCTAMCVCGDVQELSNENLGSPVPHNNRKTGDPCPGWDKRLTAAIRGLRRLAVRDGLSGMGDVGDPEGLARIEFARAMLGEMGVNLTTNYIIDGSSEGEGDVWLRQGARRARGWRPGTAT